MKNKIPIIICAVLVLLATAFIFCNSLKNEEDSVADSRPIVDVVEPIVKDVVDVDEYTVPLFIRKSAHLVEFGILGAALGCLMYFVKKRYGKTFYGFGCFYVLAVAVTDEYIQSFSDRSSSVGDVYLDFAGALIGFTVVFIVAKIILYIRNRCKA